MRPFSPSRRPPATIRFPLRKSSLPTAARCTLPPRAGRRLDNHGDAADQVRPRLRQAGASEIGFRARGSAKRRLPRRVVGMGRRQEAVQERRKIYVAPLGALLAARRLGHLPGGQGAGKFRLVFKGIQWGNHIVIEEMGLQSGFRLTNWTSKAGYACDPAAASPTDAQPQPADIIPLDRIVDLTQKLGPDGKLTWSAPAGRWTILRIGYTPTGIMLFPAPRGGAGWMATSSAATWPTSITTTASNRSCGSLGPIS